MPYVTVPWSSFFFFPNSGSNAGYRPVELAACPTSNDIDCRATRR
jgi:hypothetical protein